MVDEGEGVVELPPRQIPIRLGARDLAVQGVRVERAGTGGAQNVLAEHVQPARAQVRAVQGVRAHGVQGGPALQHLEPVGGNEKGAAGPVQAVVGAADALEQACHALGRADLDDQVHAAPVDPQVERGRRHHGLELAARHRRFHLAALLHVQRAVVQRNRQSVFVELPQFLENDFRLCARVDEDDGGARLLDRLVHLGQRVYRHVPAPGQVFARGQDVDSRLRPGRAVDARHVGCRLGRFRPARPGGQPRREAFGIAHGRGQADAPAARGEGVKPGEAQGEQVAALGPGECVQLVDHHRLQVGEEAWRIVVGQQQRQGFGRGQQDLRRLAALALAPVLRRIARARFRVDGQVHFRDGRGKVAVNVLRERLQR